MGKKKQPDHAYLKSVHVKGFRTLKDSKVSFVPGLNIVIGENGAGKSNLLSAIANGYFTSSPRYDFDLFESTVISNESDYKLDLSEANPEKSSTSKFGFESPHGIKVNHIVSLYKNGEQLYKERIITSHWENGLAKLIGKNAEFPILGAFVQFHVPFSPSFTNEKPISIIFDLDEKGRFERRQNRDHREEYVFLEKFFLKIPSWFSNQGLFENETNDLIITKLKDNEQLIESLKKYSPISDFRLNNNLVFAWEKNRLMVSNLHFEFKVNNEWLPWSFLSDGTKRLFYIIYHVIQYNPIVLIEEPELGVHPHQFHSLMLFLKEQSTEKQIILTTHSPYALNVLDNDELDNIIIAKLDKEKGTVFHHLNKKQRAKALRYMSDVGFLSDYWMHSDLEDDEEEN